MTILSLWFLFLRDLSFTSLVYYFSPLPGSGCSRFTPAQPFSCCAFLWTVLSILPTYCSIRDENRLISSVGCSARTVCWLDPVLAFLSYPETPVILSDRYTH
ncbi:hypothetical protein DFS34DRAFT_603663 [Phlyctochytrium arcticum]|nr:hypothetical protein DFS34DRAFT_603663 [Phlyctochytrium arcticum]